MVLGGVPQGGRERRVGQRVVGGREEVAEQEARAEHRPADLDDVEPRHVGQRSCAAEPEHLAALGRARSRQAAGAEQDVRREAVDRREADEPAADGALADERDRGRLAGGERRQSLPRTAVERAPALVPARGHAEPDGAHGAGGGGNALDVLGDAAVLRDGRSGEDPREHGSGGSDAERRDQRASVAATEAAEREADHVPGAPHYVGLPAARLR